MGGSILSDVRPYTFHNVRCFLRVRYAPHPGVDVGDPKTNKVLAGQLSHQVLVKR